ncbi:MAG: cation transporter [Eubacterium sp.]|nr:cation transporter [Eubacterium sp.]
MTKRDIKIAIFGISCNLSLFLIKLYVGISSNSLAIYCDSVNNLGDTFSALIALFAFIFILKSKMKERKSARVQALGSFVIGSIVAVTGAYCVYTGLERFVYPVLVSYSFKYAVLIILTACVKLVMAMVYIRSNRKSPSPIYKALILDSFLDFAITTMAVMGFFLISKLNYAIDGVFGIIIGIIILVSAAKSVFHQARFLVND